MLTGQDNQMTASDSKTLTKEEITSLILRGGVIEKSGYRVLGDVDLSGEKVEGRLKIQGVVFTGAVNFSHCRFERTLDLSKCTFEKKLDLTGARIEGSLLLDNVTFGVMREPAQDLTMIKRIVERLKEGRRRIRSDRSEPREERMRKIALQCRRRASLRRWNEQLRKAEAEQAKLPTVAEFNNLHVAGSLSMVESPVFGHFFCNYADVEKDFRVDRSWIFGDLKLRRSSLGEFRTDAVPTHNQRPCRVDGKLDFTAAQVGGDIRLIGVILGDELGLQTANVGGNLLCRSAAKRRARLKNGAWLFGVKVRGSVDFSGTLLREGLILGTGDIGGSLLCLSINNWSFKMDGDADLSNMKVGASIFLYNARLQGDVYLVGTATGGDLDFSGTYFAKNLFLQNISIGAALLARATNNLKKNFPCEVEQKLWLLGATITGAVDISGLHCGGDLIMQNASIGQTLLANIMGGVQTVIGGNAILNGMRVSGAVEFLGAVLHGDLDLSGTSIGDDLKVAFELDYANNWQIVGTVIDKKIQAESAKIGKRVILMGLVVGSINHDDSFAREGNPQDENSARRRELGSANFAGIQINSSFLLHTDDLVRELLKSKTSGYPPKEITQERRLKLLIEARRERAVIHGDLQLARAQIGSGVTLDGAIIDGELNMQDAAVRANITCRPVPMEASNNPVRAHVRKADLENLDITGDVDLTGLTILEDLILRDARVRGRLELYPFQKKGGSHGGYEKKRSPDLSPHSTSKPDITDIGGALHMDAAEVSHVIVSGESFGGRPAKQTWWDRVKNTFKILWEQGLLLLIGYLIRGGFRERNTGSGEHLEKDAIVLERATIGRLEIIRPLPGKLYLSNMNVGSWEEQASFFKDMLQQTQPFRKSNYIAIENDLRNKGQDEDADEVYVSMRRRDRRNTGNFARVLWDWLLDLSTKYGTTSVRLFWLLIVWFVASLLIFTNPAHVEYAISPSLQNPTPEVHPDPAVWDVVDATFFAVHLHVPIVQLGIDQDVQPSGDAMKAYAMVSTAASWVIWPLLIASLSGFLRKRN
jgi:hypothetical protein